MDCPRSVCKCIGKTQRQTFACSLSIGRQHSLQITDGVNECVALLQSQNGSLVQSRAIAEGKYVRISAWLLVRPRTIVSIHQTEAEKDASAVLSIHRAEPVPQVDSLLSVEALTRAEPHSLVSVVGIVISIVDWEKRIVELMDDSNHSVHVHVSERDLSQAVILRVVEVEHALLSDTHAIVWTPATVITVHQSGSLVQAVKELGMAVRKRCVRCISE